MKQSGVDQGGDNCGHGHHRVHEPPNNTEIRPHFGYGQGELPGLGHTQAHLQGRASSVTGKEGSGGICQNLAYNKHAGHHQRRDPVFLELPNIQQHANRHEEDGREHISYRAHNAAHLF